MKFVIAAVMIVHGLIHLIGLGKAYNLNHIKRWSDPGPEKRPRYVSPLIRILWLFAFLLFAIAPFAFITNKLWWSTAAIAGTLLSQLLIILHWNVAKWDPF